jgi:hypothetical protein
LYAKCNEAASVGGLVILQIAHVSGEDEVRRLKMLVHFKVGR